MTVVIVNETISVIEVLSTLVSSVEIISLSGPHRTSMIGLMGRYLNDTAFNITEICQCKVETSESSQNCESMTTSFDYDDGTTSILLLTAGPTDWQKREATVFECYHDFVPLMTYFVMAQSYINLVKNVAKAGVGTTVNYLDGNVFNSPSPWINSNTINQVLLSREDHYNKHELEKSYIKTIVSQASHDAEGYTQVTFSWREGQITKIDKFNNGSYWSLATLMCTVLLGIERCVAFVNRAKNKTPANKIKVAEAPTPTPPPGVDDANYLTKDPNDNSKLVWSGSSKKALKP